MIRLSREGRLPGGSGRGRLGLGRGRRRTSTQVLLDAHQTSRPASSATPGEGGVAELGQGLAPEQGRLHEAGVVGQAHVTGTGIGTRAGAARSG